MNRDGALAQQLRFPARSAHAVPPSVAVEDAVFAEPTAVALRAVLRSGAEPRSRVLVVGGGTLGWLAAAVFLDLLDADVAALEPDAGRMQRLLALGVRAVAADELFDVVLEASGSRGGVTEARDRLGSRGRLVVGLTGSESVPVDLDRVVVNDQVILGSLGSPDVWARVMDVRSPTRRTGPETRLLPRPERRHDLRRDISGSGPAAVRVAVVSMAWWA